MASQPSLIVAKSRSNADADDDGAAGDSPPRESPPSAPASFRAAASSYGSLGDLPAASFCTANARSHPSDPIVCTAGMSNLEKNASRLRRASNESPEYPGARDSAASTATRV